MKIYPKNFLSALLISLYVIVGAEMPVLARALETTNPVSPPLKENTMIHGFKQRWTQDVEEVKAQAQLYEHEKSGAQLLYFVCEDDNKVFSITFRTPPTDDTGIAHIMEHSVLCGSQNFPSKEPFVDLLKGSLQTFLNAFTSSDRTMYPVASRNEKDFMNLMHVYMDAVFFPRLKEVPEILMQEGWHYEVDEETGELTYNGIVYNEMKGVFSSPHSLLYRLIDRNLFPDGTYGFESGGEPNAIPELTQEQFVEFHNKYYHPSNSLIFLYGNGNLEEQLRFLNEEYLNHFDRQVVDSGIVLQPTPTEPKEVHEFYSVDPDDSTEDKTFLSLNYVVGNSPDAELHFAMNLLSYVLVDSQAAPLRRALIDADLGMDVEGIWENSIVQPWFGIIVKNTNPNRKEEFENIVNNTLKELVAKGIDRKLIEGAINRTEFSLREFQISRYPKGLVVNMQLIDSWAYDADPLMYLRFEPVLKKIKEEVPNHYFEKLIQEKLLDNPARLLLVLEPKQGLDKENSENLKQRLEQIRQSLSEEQIAQIREQQQVLVARQAAPDSPEDVAKIPTLDRSDIDPKAEEFPIANYTLGGTTVLNHDLETNKIAYLTIYFDASSIPFEWVPYTSLLAEIIGSVDTEKYTYADLTSEVNIHTGGIGTGYTAISGKDSNTNYYPRFSFGTKTMLPKLEKGLELIVEMMLTSKYEDKTRLNEIVKEQRVGMEQQLLSAGHEFAQLRAASYFSPVHRYKDAIGGLPYYQFLLDLERNFDTKSDELVVKLKEAARLLFNRQGMLLSITVSKDDFEQLQGTLTNFVNAIPSFDFVPQPIIFEPKQANEAVIIPSRVQYVAKAADFRADGFAYSGKWNVLTKILQTGYLWNNIRVQGGAYGSGFGADRSGLLTFMSYRDPHLGRTLKIFDGTADFLANLEMSDLDLTKAIIATTGGMDRPRTPAEKGTGACIRYIVGLTQDEVQRDREMVLSTTVEDLRGFSKPLRQAMQQNNICVFGNEEKINESRSDFKNVIRINP